VVHINGFPLLGDTQVVLGILSSCSLLTFLSHMNSTSFFLLISFGKFHQKNYANMLGHYESKIMGIFLGPFSKALGFITDIL
jgi:hypothetical protein